MSKRLIVLFAVVVLLISINAVGAQGNGNDRGNCDPQQATCPNNLQGRGGRGNTQSDNTRNGRGQGNMNSGMSQNGTGLYTNLPAATQTELPQDVIDLMISGWLDEQHAYAVYGGVLAQFGNVRPFINIQRAEAQHIAAWEFLFDRYGIAIPELPTVEVPQFPSLTEACQLAADAEVANFDLYDTMLTAFTNYPDIYQVTLTLRNVSEFNHLPAFQQCSG